MTNHTFFIRRDPIDAEMFHLYNAKAVTPIEHPGYHVAAIHRDHLSDLLQRSDPDLKLSVMGMDESVTAQVTVFIEEVSWK